MPIGILALQGAVEPHHHKLRSMGVETMSVRTAEDLRRCQGLIIPGGESTTFLKLVDQNNLRKSIVTFAERQSVWGVCAGSILMAKEVENPPQESFGLVPIRVRRNAYGRQNESFIALFELNLPGGSSMPQEGVFIRAPQVVEWEDDVIVIGKYDEKPVVLQYQQHLITTFHPELSESTALHQYFVSLTQQMTA